MASGGMQMYRMGIESGFLLVFGCYGNLVVTRITIQETIVFMPCQPVQHLIHKMKWELIFSECFIELPIVYADSPSNHYSKRDQCVALFLA